MRILHIITSLRSGGAERMVCDILPRLRGRGHSAELLLFDGTRTHLYDSLEREGIPVRAFGKGACQMWNPFHFFRLRKLLKREKYDIVHTHNTPCQLLTAFAAPKSGPTLVTTEHNTFNRRRNWKWFRVFDRMMYRRYSHVICVGEQTESNLSERLGDGGDAPEMSVVPNGIDLSRFAGACPPADLRLPDELGKKIVIMVSAFRAQKDQPSLIRAMMHLPENYRLWLVGGWNGRASCEELAAELGLSGRIRFWGVREDVPELLAASDVVVLSSHYEGMSLASIEGMASGKPFIASDVEGLRETVGGAGLLFPCGDHERLAGLIRQVCEDEEFAARVVERCMERAGRYDIGKVADSYSEIYGKLLKQNNKSLI